MAIKDMLLAEYDQEIVTTRKLLERVPAADADFAAPWSLRSGETVHFSLPHAAVVRSFCFNHLVHHRAQLGVYLRLRDVPLPPCYGPTADGPA